MSKRFTSILNKRITVLCDTFNIISDAQFGFRKERLTVDAVFVLMSNIQKFMFENKRLYVVFVDLMKCYDTINRNVLWLKLFKLGINGKCLCIIKDIYRRVKSCVSSCNSYYEYFEYAIGLRQGEAMSPVMFSLFMSWSWSCKMRT